MPPKKLDKKSEKGIQKSIEKQKQKIIEDKTFGLKNKNKSKTVQKYIKGVQQTAKNANVSEQKLILREQQQKDEKKKQQQQAALLASIFKGTEQVKKLGEAQSIKIRSPATIKADQQIDLYIDQRDQKRCDIQEKSEDVQEKNGQPQTMLLTDIVCKYFVEAVENKQYGWFWQCPNGGDNCKYRHCLPPGYILQRQNNTEDESEEEEPLEDRLERERQQLSEDDVKVTLESFMIWKEKKKQQKAEEEEKQLLKSKKAGANYLSGKDLFILDPNLFVDDAGAAAENDYEIHEQELVSTVVKNQEDKQSESSDTSSLASSQEDLYVENEELFLEGDDPEESDLEVH